MAAPQKPLPRIIERNTSLAPVKPPYIGYVRTGTINPKTKKGMPLDHFHLVPANKNHTQYIADFEKCCGRAPSEIYIFFYSSEPGFAYIHQHEAYEYKEKLGYGDGVRFGILHPLRKQMVYATKVEFMAMPDTDDIKKQWNYLLRRELWEEKIQLHFFIKDFPVLGMFTYKSIGKLSTVPSILRTLDGITAELGGFHNLLFKLVMHVGHKAGTPQKYVAVDLQPAYSFEQIKAIKLGIRNGMLNLDRNTYMDIDQYVQQVCPTRAIGEHKPFSYPVYNTEMDADQHFAEFDEDEAKDIADKFGSDTEKDLLDNEDATQVKMDFHEEQQDEHNIE